MIGTLVRVSWTNLRRDRAAQMLVFVVPIAFFSIFAFIFGGRGGNFSTGRVSVAVVDQSQTPRSRALVAALKADSSLRASTTWKADNAPKGAAAVPIDAALAEKLVRDGEVQVGMILPAGLDTSLARFDGRGVKVKLLFDRGDPVAPKIASGLLQRATLTALRSEADEFRGAPAPGQVAPTVDDMMPARFQEQAVLGDKPTSPMISFYAAGIAVMFIMFSAAGGGGALIEETESGTLERVLTSGIGMNGLLLAKWAYLTSLGVVQVCVMFTWGMLAFRLPLLTHLPGFLLMTVCTAACAASFGLVLATAASTRQQLSGMSNLFVLSLSAIGGSMFPRFLMSEQMQKFSLIGFNAWALDGYLKVFWRETPLAALAPQIGALLGFTVLFLFLSRRFAKRWEAA